MLSATPCGEIAEIRTSLPKKNDKVHMLGICGVGMAGLALLLKKKGFGVSGCDSSPNQLAAWLKKNGISVYSGHSPSHIKDADWIIKSAAVPHEDAELKAAKMAGKKIFRRGLVLAQLASDSDSICVCGTHGKTTTTAMIAQLLKKTGKKPSFCIGGEVSSLGGVAGQGTGRNIVLEADESDGTLAYYHPLLTVITNVEFDHAEHFANLAELKRCFSAVAVQTRGRIIYCFDDKEARNLLRGRPNTLSYGFSSGADLQLHDFRETANSLSFSLKICREFRAINLPLSGRHNALNAAAACAVALELRIPFKQAANALKIFRPVLRRFERIIDTKDLAIISDYAHHPSEISAFMKSARKLKRRRLLAVFQPHRYSRTRALGKLFPPAFDGVTELILCPVYEASEKPLAGGLAADLYGHFRKYGKINVHRATSPQQAWNYLKTILAPGDAVLIIGAGDVCRIGEWAKKELSAGERATSDAQLSTLNFKIKPCCRKLKPKMSDSWRVKSEKMPLTVIPSEAKNLVVGMDEILRHPAVRGIPLNNTPKNRSTQVKVGSWNFNVSKLLTGRLKSSIIKLNEPMAGKTTLGVGGSADIFVEVGDKNDLAVILKRARRTNVPVKIIGAGSNLLVSDLGVRGLVLQLKGAAWQDIRQIDSTKIAAGAGVRLQKLASWAAQRGLAGAEFLAGIPGTLGGAARMNAGAWGHAVGDIIEQLNVIESDGKFSTRGNKQCAFAYRACPALENRIVLEAVIRLKKGNISAIRKMTSKNLEKRKWMSAFRSAGSIFKNPAGNCAGRLIEGLSLKGKTIGKAAVSGQHANVITTRKGANASDVLSLIEIIRFLVRMKHGIELEREVEYWE